MLKKDMIKTLQEKEESLWNRYYKNDELFGIESDLTKRYLHQWGIVNDLLNELGISPTRNGIEIKLD